MSQSLTIITPPTVEPLTLDDLKDQVRITTDDDRVYLAGLATAARQYCEKRQGVALAPTTFKLTLDRFPWGLWYQGIIHIPRPPLQEVLSVKYVDDLGDLTTIDPSTYIVDTDSKPGRICPVFGTIWPLTVHPIATVEITYIAGYTAANIPFTTKQAMKLIVGTWYVNREGIVADRRLLELPMGVEALLSLDDPGIYP